MSFTGQELEKLRSELPRGSAKKLATKFEMSVGSVRNILSGLSNNDEVIIEASKMAAAYQAGLLQTKNALAIS